MPKGLGSSDRLIWDQFREGNNDSFESIYRAYIQELISYGRRIYDDRELVVDCAQQLFTNLLERRKHLGPTDSIKFYLFKALRTIILKELKKSKHTDFQRNLSKLNNESQSSFETSLINEEQNQEHVRRLNLAVEKLSPREKEILYLKFYSGLSNQEISDMLSINYQSVKNTATRAIQKLKDEMINVCLVLILGLLVSFF